MKLFISYKIKIYSIVFRLQVKKQLSTFSFGKKLKTELKISFFGVCWDSYLEVSLKMRLIEQISAIVYEISGKNIQYTHFY